MILTLEDLNGLSDLHLVQTLANMRGWYQEDIGEEDLGWFMPNMEYVCLEWQYTPCDTHEEANEQREELMLSLKVTDHPDTEEVSYPGKTKGSRMILPYQNGNRPRTIVTACLLSLFAQRATRVA